MPVGKIYLREVRGLSREKKESRKIYVSIAAVLLEEFLRKYAQDAENQKIIKIKE